MTYRQPDETNTDTVTRYASDLTDAEWELIAPLFPPKTAYGRERKVAFREIMNAIQYRLRTGCQWRMLPKDFPAWGHVSNYYYTWKKRGLFARINAELVQLVRAKSGHDAEPSVIVVDSQSVKTTAVGGEKGFDPHKRVKGRKRTTVVDTLGCILFVVVCAASIADTEIGTHIAYTAKKRFPRVKTILADNGYASENLKELFQKLWNSVLVIAPRNKETRAFTPQPQRWKSERSFAWLAWNRLLTAEYERTTDSSEADICCASIRHLLRRIIRAEESGII
jgi:transposase